MLLFMMSLSRKVEDFLQITVPPRLAHNIKVETVLKWFTLEVKSCASDLLFVSTNQTY